MDLREKVDCKQSKLLFLAIWKMTLEVSVKLKGDLIYLVLVSPELREHSFGRQVTLPVKMYLMTAPSLKGTLSCHLLSFWKAKMFLACIEVQKLFRVIFRHWNCFQSSVAKDGKDGHVTEGRDQKRKYYIRCNSALWWNLFDSFLNSNLTLQEDFLYW